MKLLNLGCGTRYLDDWTNIDFVSSGPSVKAHNLLDGIPFSNNEFDVVYHSHVLEHFPKDRAHFFIQECYRVLKPGGILRVAVPDLEQIARIYLQQLEKVLASPDPVNEANYEWAVIELFDQIARQKSGGEMADYWRKTDLLNSSWIESRMGNEFISFREGIAKRKGSPPPKRKDSIIKKYLRTATYKKKLAEWLTGERHLFEYLALGRFRRGGEIHQWMYDRYSLTVLLTSVGFNSISKVEATESSIPDWTRHQWLDIENDKIRKPDSIFMEGRK